MWTSLIESYQLKPHPEGGYYKETYRSPQTVLKGDAAYDASTGIFFLLVQNSPSRFHRIQSDEMWHFYTGDSLHIHELSVDGTYRLHTLGADWLSGQHFQRVIPAGSWFAAETVGDFSFVGCTVAPGFVFSEFELATTTELIERYPDQEALIRRLT